MRVSKHVSECEKNKFRNLIFILFIFLFTPLQSAIALTDHPACGELGRDWSKGFEMPIPFSTNQKVELADKEYYILAGILRQSGRDYYLEVDLDVHPWLASTKRQLDPYYLIEITPDATHWLKLKNRRVKVLIEAIGQIRDENNYLPARYEVILKALARPLLFVESKDYR